MGGLLWAGCHLSVGVAWLTANQTGLRCCMGSTGVVAPVVVVEGTTRAWRTEEFRATVLRATGQTFRTLPAVSG